MNIQKWHLVFTFPLSGSIEEAPSRVVAIMPWVENDPRHELPEWFFDEYVDKSTGESWMYDSIGFWRQPDGSWMREYVPQIGPNPVWQSASSPGDVWSPLVLQNWDTVLLRLADWQQRTFFA